MSSNRAGLHIEERATNDSAADTTLSASFLQSASTYVAYRAYRATLSKPAAAKSKESFAEAPFDYRLSMRQPSRFTAGCRSQIDQSPRPLRVSFRDAKRMFGNHNEILDFASGHLGSHLVSQTEQESEHSEEVSHFKYLDRGWRPNRSRRGGALWARWEKAKISMRNHQIAILTTILTVGVAAPPAISQTSNPVPYGSTTYSATDQVTTIGHVVSSSRHTIMIRQNETGLYQLFIIANDAVRPQGKIPDGSGVTIISTPGDDPDVRVAHFIAQSNLPPQPVTTPSTVPQSIQRLDRSIQRAARFYSIGLYTGFTLDPEQVPFGINARFGPIFGDIYFRPGFEFALGEISKSFILNLEGVYRLPVTNRLGPWSTYIGVGPSLNWACLCAHDFSEFSFNAGLNILMGMQWRSGLFIEGKASVWTVPHLHVLVGYQF